MRCTRHRDQIFRVFIAAFGGGFHIVDGCGEAGELLLASAAGVAVAFEDLHAFCVRSGFGEREEGGFFGEAFGAKFAAGFDLVRNQDAIKGALAVGFA